MQPAQHIGQVDAQDVSRYVGLRTFARLPRLEDVEAVDAAILGAPFDLGSTFRTGSRYGPAAIREASLLLKPYSEPHDVFPFDDMQVVDAETRRPARLTSPPRMPPSNGTRATYMSEARS